MHTSRVEVKQSIYQSLSNIYVSGQFKSAAIIIRDELTEDQKDRFVAHLVEAFSEFHPEDAVALVAILMTNQALVVTKIGQFLISEMGMNIID